MQRLAPLNATVGPTYFVALRIALAAAAGTTIQPRLPSRSTASVSRITTPAASADLCQASSIPPGLCVDSGPKAIRRLSRVPRGAADRHRPGRAGRKDGDRPDRVEGLIESFLHSRARSQDIGL